MRLWQTFNGEDRPGHRPVNHGPVPSPGKQGEKMRDVDDCETTYELYNMVEEQLGEWGEGSLSDGEEYKEIAARLREHRSDAAAWMDAAQARWEELQSD